MISWIYWEHYSVLSWRWPVKKADHQKSKLGRGTVNTWERNHTVTRGTPGTWSSLCTLPSAIEWGLAPTQVVPVIRDSQESQPICVCDPMDWSRETSLSMEFSRQEYWSGKPFPPPGIFRTHGLNPGLLHQQTHYLPLHHLGIKDKNGMDLTEAEDIKKRWQE